MINLKQFIIWHLALVYFGIGHLFITQPSKLDKEQPALYTNQTMNKDAVAAAAVGFTIGLIVAVLLWIGPRFITSRNQQQVNLNSDQSSTTAAKITLKSPGNGEVVKNKLIKVEGTAPINDLIVITSPAQEAITNTAPDGSFTTSITLEEGENTLSVSAYTETGDIHDNHTISVIYTSENL